LQAYAIGRDAMQRGSNLLDVVELHQAVLEELTPPGHVHPEAAALAREAVSFLTESLSPFEMALRGYREANGELAHANEDLERRVAERTAELQRAEERYRLLVEHMPVITYVTPFDRDGPAQYVSPQVVTLLGTPSQVWTQDQVWRDRIHPEDLQRVLERRKSAALHQERFAEEYRMVQTSGTTVWVRDEAVPVQNDQADDGLLYQGILQDITQRKAVEYQLQESQKVDSIGRLAGGVAHDFNNLLSVVLSYAAMAQEGLAPDDPLRSDLEQIHRAGERAADLTRQLLAFSRRQVFQTKVIELNDLVHELERMLRRLIGEDIELVTELEPGLWQIRVDPGQIEQVVVNLAINARDAMPEGGRLTLRTVNTLVDREHAAATLPAGRYVKLEVEDTGTGMSTEVKSHIFEPFYTTKAKGRGTGLGLSTCIGIVKQSGGEIVVESALRKGSKFCIFLPAVDPVARPTSTPSVPERDVRGHETILLVEDDPAVRGLTLRVLTQQGYAVLAAESGHEALELERAHPEPIELLLTDVVMPGMGGREVARRLRALRPTLSVLYASGYPDDAIFHAGTLDGTEAFIHKPFTPSSLTLKVREVLDDAERRRRHKG
jgi:two-component system cell cycle sensor histidine kinase/response regulator CckA